LVTFVDIGAVPAPAARRLDAIRPHGGFALRPAVLADRPALAAIAAAAFAQGVAVLLPPELRARADAARFTCFLAATPGVLLLAEANGVPVGCALATLPAENDPPARLQGLWVAPGQNGQGIGSALLAAMEETLGRQGVGSLRVRVPSGQLRALGLFRRRGYALRTAGLRPEPVLEAMLRHSVLAKPLLTAVAA
jgi:ribosomal-protein-alanine N-acetyltransferase